jgi:hypothetical protein
MAITISPDVADVLSRSTINGMLLTLPAGQLDRNLYMSTDKVLKALGGKWDRKAGGHKFPFDPSPKIQDALGNGNVVSRQQSLQLFETPSELADHLCSFLDINSDDTCLEPSAGLGRIITALDGCKPASITAVEIDQDNITALQAQGLAGVIRQGDFLEQDPQTLQVSKIAMNPPFAKNADIRHVRHAFACLKPGGRLAAIVGEHSFFGQERECAEWRDWLDSLCAYVEPVAAGAFKKSGTGVASRIVVLNKPA